MKKTLLLITIILTSVACLLAQTTAADFTANDCNGTSHNLFSELNAGKIIVVSLVHPCSSCIAPTVSANTIVKGYATTNPGKVFFYLVDANNSCSSLSTWANTYSLNNVVKFSDPAVYNSSYYSPSMPTIMIFSGANHAVSFRQDGALNAANFTAAINQAIAVSGVNEEQKRNFQLSIFPNPVNDKLSLTYFLSQTSEVKIDLYDMLGSKIANIISERQSSGKHDSQYNFDQLSNGIYFLKLSSGDASQIIRFTVSH